MSTLAITGGAVNASLRITEYFGLIEGVATQVTKLLHQAFLSATYNLEYARTSIGQNQIDYVKRAKDRFMDAVAVEENENKILALVGLSMCQYFLRDYTGAQRSLNRIQDVQLTRAEKMKYRVLDTLPYVNISIYIMIPGTNFLEGRIRAFEDMKQETITFNQRLIG